MVMISLYHVYINHLCFRCSTAVRNSAQVPAVGSSIQPDSGSIITRLRVNACDDRDIGLSHSSVGRTRDPILWTGLAKAVKFRW